MRHREEQMFSLLVGVSSYSYTSTEFLSASNLELKTLL